MTTIDDFTKSVSAGFKVITAPSGSLSGESDVIFDRDDILPSIMSSLVSIRDGLKRHVIISAPPGSGRSHLLRFLCKSMNRFENVRAFYNSASSYTKLSDFNCFSFDIPKENAMPTVSPTTSPARSEPSMIMFMDDIDIMLISWNTNGRFLKYLSTLDDKNYSIVATSSSIPPALMKAIKWNDVITMELLSRQSIARIVKNLVQMGISKEINVDDSAIDLCALLATRSFKSSISSAVAIMERAARAIERDLISGERTERSIMMKDIEDGAASMRSLSPNPAIAGSKVLVMAMLFVMKRATVANLHARVFRVTKLVYQDREPPSIHTVRNVLNSMVSSGIARKVRSSEGRATGVKTTWICDMPVGQIETAMPSEIARVMKLIANGGKRNG